MKTRCSSENVQHRALVNLAFNSNNQITIAARGGIEVIVTALATHCKIENVQHVGCWAFKNLALNVNNRIRIASKGGIVAIWPALKANNSSENVQHFGCWALFDLAIKQPNRNCC